MGFISFTSHFMYCNDLHNIFCGLPDRTLLLLNRVMNQAAQPFLVLSYRDHITPAFRSPLASCIWACEEVRIPLAQRLCKPSYLSSMVIPCSSSREQFSVVSIFLNVCYSCNMSCILPVHSFAVSGTSILELSYSASSQPYQNSFTLNCKLTFSNLFMGLNVSCSSGWKVISELVRKHYQISVVSYAITMTITTLYMYYISATWALWSFVASVLSAFANLSVQSVLLCCQLRSVSKKFFLKWY